MWNKLSQPILITFDRSFQMVSNSFFERGLRGERNQTCPYMLKAKHLLRVLLPQDYDWVYEDVELLCSIIVNLNLCVRILMFLRYLMKNRHFHFCYSELDSSGSVKKLTLGVSLKRKSGETELYILFNKLFLFTLIQFMKYFNL